MGWFKKTRKQILGRLPNVGETVVYCTGEGCQAMDVIRWVGRVSKVESDKVHVDVIKYNNSYSDIRDSKPVVTEVLYTPEGAADLQKVDNIWIMFI